MTLPDRAPSETRRRHVALVVGSVVVVALFVLMANQFDGLQIDDGLTPASELVVGDCFLYPGDGVGPTRVEAIDCSLIHYGEVVGTTTAGNNDACVGLFESYTGATNYWETGLILGFIPIDDVRMHCYLYGPEDFAGSMRG